MQPTDLHPAKTCVANLCAEFADVIFVEEFLHFEETGADCGKMNAARFRMFFFSSELITTALLHVHEFNQMLLFVDW